VTRRKDFVKRVENKFFVVRKSFDRTIISVGFGGYTEKVKVNIVKVELVWLYFTYMY